MAKFPTYEEMGKKIAEEALDGYIYNGKTLREWVDILNRSENQNKWIPVSEGLPKDYVTVMVTVEGMVVPEARYSKKDGWEWAYESGSDYWEELYGVVAWMPLPEPYKEGE